MPAAAGRAGARSGGPARRSLRGDPPGAAPARSAVRGRTPRQKKECLGRLLDAACPGRRDRSAPWPRAQARKGLQRGAPYIIVEAPALPGGALRGGHRHRCAGDALLALALTTMSKARPASSRTRQRNDRAPAVAADRVPAASSGSALGGLDVERPAFRPVGRRARARARLAAPPRRADKQPRAPPAAGRRRLLPMSAHEPGAPSVVIARPAAGVEAQDVARCCSRARAGVLAGQGEGIELNGIVDVCARAAARRKLRTACCEGVERAEQPRRQGQRLRRSGVRTRRG